jgi:hypothetical protein
MRWSKEELKILEDNYPNMEGPDLCKLLPRRDIIAIRNKISRHSLQKRVPRKVVLDFSKIDSEEKAYILGMWSADGCINHRAINLWLQESDEDILIKIRNLASPDSPISYKRGYKNTKAQKGLCIYNTELLRSLSSYNIIPKKSKVVNPPVLPPELTRHFIRGLFDGDGCVRMGGRNHNRPEANITGNKQMITFVHQCFSQVWANNYNVTQSGTSWCVTYSGRDAWHFLRYIYEGSNLYMDRKHSKAKEIIDNPEPIHNCIWRPHEDDLLRKNYDIMLREDLMKKLPGRNWSGIQMRAFKLGLKRKKNLRFY